MQRIKHTDDIEEVDLAISATRPVLPPRAHCVAASNGWIVAVVECSHPPNVINNMSSSSAASSTSAGMMMHQQQQSKQGLTALIPPLRLVSRWNVRRGNIVGIGGESFGTIATSRPTKHYRRNCHNLQFGRELQQQ